MNNLDYADTVNRIIKRMSGLNDFWSNSSGWARVNSTKILNTARLDILHSQSKSLYKFVDIDSLEEDEELIIAWTTLGSLVEGTMKLFLTIWIEEYNNEKLMTDLPAVKDRSGNLISPDDLAMDQLKQFFSKRIYPKKVRKILKTQGSIDWIDWIGEVQIYRNSIHSFKARKIGDKNEFRKKVNEYLQFLRDLTSEFPYPDDSYSPTED